MIYDNYRLVFLRCHCLVLRGAFNNLDVEWQVIIDPNQMYIDTRLGFEPDIDKRALLGSEWIMRGTDQKWLVPVQVNSGGYLVQMPRIEHD